MNNQGSSGSGIVFNSGGTLRVEACAVRGFGSDFSQGIGFSNAGKLLVKDTTIGECSHGLVVSPASGTVRATIDHVTVDGGGGGVWIEASGTGTSVGAIRDSSISGGSGTGILTVGQGGGAVALLNVERCLVTNENIGLLSQNSLGVSAMSISNCLISHNSGAGFIVDVGTTIFSRGNNSFFGNGPNEGSLTPAAPQ